MARLEKWFLYQVGDLLEDDLASIEQIVLPRLAGNVYGHPEFEDGKLVHTSPIIKLEGDYVVTFSGSRYVLGGTINPEAFSFAPEGLPTNRKDMLRVLGERLPLMCASQLKKQEERNKAAKELEEEDN